MNKILLLLFLVASISANAGPSNITQDTINILFIGNSLTYSNNLPGLVEERGIQENLEIKTKVIALPNYALIDHWNDGTIQVEIKNGNYDYVFIQQGPSSQSWGREILIEYGRKIKSVCDEQETELVYFMVWASIGYYQTYNDVIKNHEDAAALNNALLCPVGKQWKAYFDSTQDFSYYGSDGFHPSLKGSKNAAEVIVDFLLGLK